MNPFYSMYFATTGGMQQLVPVFGQDPSHVKRHVKQRGPPENAFLLRAIAIIIKDSRSQLFLTSTTLRSHYHRVCML